MRVDDSGSKDHKLKGIVWGVSKITATDIQDFTNRIEECVKQKKSKLCAVRMRNANVRNDLKLMITLLPCCTIGTLKG